MRTQLLLTALVVASTASALPLDNAQARAARPRSSSRRLPSSIPPASTRTGRGHGLGGRAESDSDSDWEASTTLAFSAEPTTARSAIPTTAPSLIPTTAPSLTPTTAPLPVVTDYPSAYEVLEMITEEKRADGSSANEDEIAKAGVLEVVETVYEAVKSFLKKLRPTVKIPGYTHYVG